MATYKPPPPGPGEFPRPNKRTDGMIQTFNRQTNTLGTWRYPGQKQTPRFQLTNGTAQYLAQRWYTLTMAQQIGWYNFFSDGPGTPIGDPPSPWYYFLCTRWKEDNTPYYPENTGIAAFTATNEQRLAQGLAFTDDAPSDIYDPTDTATIWNLPAWQLQITTTGLPPSQIAAVSIYGRPRANAPQSVPRNTAGYTYITTITTGTYLPIDLQSTLDNSGIFTPGGYRDVLIHVAQPASIPRFIAGPTF